MGDIIVDVYTETPHHVHAQVGGQTGAYSTFEIAETVTGAPGTLAKAENLGTKTAVKLKLTIPQGKQGDKGDTGEKGDKGDDYVLTASDKTEIARKAAALVAYVQDNEPPADAPENSLWVDTDEEAVFIARAEGVGF